MANITPALKRKIESLAIGDVFKHRGIMYRIVTCDGEAHSNPHIDNCMSCAPLWGRRVERADRPVLEVAAPRLTLSSRIAQARVLDASKALAEAIKLSSAAWAEVCKDFDDAAAWAAHSRTQAWVKAARAEYTRAKVAARLEKK
jgi:hypothetical protein